MVLSVSAQRVPNLFSKLAQTVRHSHTSCAPADALPPHPPDFVGTTLDLVTNCHLDPSDCEHVRHNRKLAAERLSACPALHAIYLEVEPRWWACARAPLAKLRVLRHILHERHKALPAHQSAWVMWLDADALYLLPSLQIACLPDSHVSLRRWLPSSPTIHLVASRDQPSHPFLWNSGGIVLRASTWSKNVLDGLLALGSAPLMRIATQSGALKYSECDARSGEWPCQLAKKWHRDPVNRNNSAVGFDCCWPEQGRINNFFLGHRAGLHNVSILPASTLDARPSAPLNASRMLVVHQAGCTKDGGTRSSCSAALYATAARSGFERVSAFGF